MSRFARLKKDVTICLSGIVCMMAMTDQPLDLQVSYAIGVAQPLSVHVDTYGTGKKPDKEILAAVVKNFDFRPGMAFSALNLYQTIFS